MKRRTWTAPILVVVLGTVGLLQLRGDEPKRLQPAASQDNISLYFSPKGGCTEAVVAEIEKAKTSIQLQAYSFTSAPIAKAILGAHKRGVEITAVLDKSQRTEKYSSATFLHNEGVPVFIDDNHAIAHNKIILIDGSTIITGSFNFTKAAEENNAENLLVIHDKADLYAAYATNFKEHLGHSVKYEGRVGQAEPARGPPGDPPAVQEQAQDVTVYVTRSGKKYHTETCASVANDAIPMKLSDAKAKGYTPCSRCNPPQ